jgi:hypothetical protein
MVGLVACTLPAPHVRALAFRPLSLASASPALSTKPAHILAFLLLLTNASIRSRTSSAVGSGF